MWQLYEKDQDNQKYFATWLLLFATPFTVKLRLYDNIIIVAVHSIRDLSAADLFLCAIWSLLSQYSLGYKI